MTLSIGILPHWDPMDESPNGGPSAPRECSKGWGARCAKAKGPRCKCACDGHNHGNPKANPDNKKSNGKNRTPTDPCNPEFQPFLHRIDRDTCRWCGEELCGPVYGYPHDGGWEVNGRRWWLYIHCDKCGYDWSLWKLGVAT